MKMADGSVRPAYNVQFTTAAEGAHIVGVRVTDRGSDHGLLEPAVNEIEQRYGVKPARMLADGGYTSKNDIEKVHALGVELFSPLPKSKGDPAAPKRGDEAGTIAWRQRMASDEAMAIIEGALPPNGLMLTCATTGLRQLAAGAERRRSRPSYSGTFMPSTSSSSTPQRVPERGASTATCRQPSLFLTWKRTNATAPHPQLLIPTSTVNYFTLSGVAHSIARSPLSGRES